MRRWRTVRSLGLWSGAFVWVGALLLGTAALLELWDAFPSDPTQWQIGMANFALFLAMLAAYAVAGGVSYRLASAWTLTYSVDRNSLLIGWLGNSYVIPLDRVESVDVGAPGATPPWFGNRLFGYRSGLGHLRDGRPLHMFATAPLKQALVIYTPDAAYAISPRFRDEFMQELEQRRGLGVIQPLHEGIQRSRYLHYAFWLDRPVWVLLSLSVVLNVLLWGVLAWTYADLSSTLLLRLDPTGGVVEPRYRLLIMPLVCLGLILGNLLLGLRLYRRERGAAILLQMASVLVHLVAFAALLMLLLNMV